MASVATVISTLAVAAPPEAEVAETEPAVLEVAETEVAETEVAETEVAEIEPAPQPEPEPEPALDLPAYDSALPTYDDPRVPADPPAQQETPPDGLGSLAIGVMMLSGGAILATSSALLIEQGRDTTVWTIGAMLATFTMAASTGAIAAGAIKRKRYKPYQLEHAPPQRGTGMLASGTLATSAGAFGMLMGGISLARQDDDDLPYGQVLLSLGGLSVATGVALLTVGATRRKKFDDWEQVRMTPSVGLIPGPRLMSPTGATVGVAGRF